MCACLQEREREREREREVAPVFLELRFHAVSLADSEMDVRFYPAPPSSVGSCTLPTDSGLDYYHSNKVTIPSLLYELAVRQMCGRCGDAGARIRCTWWLIYVYIYLRMMRKCCTFSSLRTFFFFSKIESSVKAASSLNLVVFLVCLFFFLFSFSHLWCA